MNTKHQAIKKFMASSENFEKYQKFLHSSLSGNDFLQPDIQVIFCGFEECSANKRKVEKNALNHSLHLIVKGEGYVTFKNKRTLVKSGDMFMCLPNETFSYYPNQSKPWDYYFVDFSGRLQDDFCKDLGFDKNQYIRRINSREIIGHFAELISATTTKGTGSLLCKAMFYKLADAIADDKKTQQASLDNKEQYVVKAILYIRNNLATVNVKNTALNAAVSHEYLTKLFKNYLGINLKEYIMCAKLKNAKYFLEQTNLTLENISMQIGFSTSKYFIRLFKEVFDTTPAAYRLKTQKKGLKSN